MTGARLSKSQLDAWDECRRYIRLSVTAARQGEPATAKALANLAEAAAAYAASLA